MTDRPNRCVDRWPQDASDLIRSQACHDWIPPAPHLDSRDLPDVELDALAEAMLSDLRQWLDETEAKSA